MKKKDIYEVIIKIIGIIAVCKFIESLIISIIAYITFHIISTNIKFDLMGISQTNFSILTVSSIVLYGLFSYLFLFMTDKVLHLFRLSKPDELTLQIEKKVIYHISVLLIGFFMFTYSGNQLISSTFSNGMTNKQSTIGQSPTGEETVKGMIYTSVSPSTHTTVNYMGILIFLFSIPIILKSKKISELFIPKEKETIIE